ncbi:FAD-dependent monooxygenase [Criblamydia sequanensis]|uniref:FAD-binding domain-containing protein n=1 Tax=Candidatus Criblamydia sequanensis CRIB-18 TaxID=1437425 RepID=A0A090D3D2_9BACT|nr:FAD-dependent monooxygenase [Criblamydia sequanensis]CDR35178.1 hypothetical protein CSEC_2372 [Criblamydia sequanensis CRIB-18]
MKKVIYLFVLIASLLFILKKDNKPLQVLIIGGGPAGLAAAIEAKSEGAEVTLVEKRKDYNRQQVLFLGKTTIGLLTKWRVEPKALSICQARNGSKVGIIKICDLEASLKEKVNHMGVKVLFGEFVKANAKGKKALIRSEDKLINLSYDLIIGADGRESALRKEFNLPLKKLGKASGTIAFIPMLQKNIPDITDTIKAGPFFLRKITLENASIIFMQSSQEYTLDDFSRCVADLEWSKEAELIQKNEVKIFTGIPVYLQKVERLSDPENEVLLVGDAAATASFFEGRGGNTGFKEASLIGPFIKNFLQDKKKAYLEFNETMKVLTEELVEASRYLFKDE